MSTPATPSSPVPCITHITRAVSTDLPATTILKAAPLGTPEPIVLQENVFASQLATDLAGRVVWFYPSAPLSFMTRPAGNGTFFGIIQDPQGDPWKQVLREFNLIGLTIRETNAGRINEQLRPWGSARSTRFTTKPCDCPTATSPCSPVSSRFSPAFKGAVRSTFSATWSSCWTPTSTSSGLGTPSIISTPTAQLRSATNACRTPARRFNSAPRQTTGPMATPSKPLPTAICWCRLRNQDWVVKINYDSGEGNGDVLWRLGSGGDFKLVSPTPTLWFSHQHDPAL